MKRSSLRISLFLWPLLLLLLPACAAERTVVSVASGNGPALVRLEESSFAFVPTVIRARQGDRLLFRVVNRADAAHNLTVENPRGEDVVRVDLTAGQTVEIPLHLSVAGTWPFYCDRFLHKTLGMRGTVEVSPGQ